jgi:hypothetical protein
MVAVTGSLAMNNATDNADLDYLVVTRPGRLWLTRALVILLVRIASRWEDTLCPNYFISENNLLFPVRSLFSAHEVVQMVPLAGLQVYEKICRLNAWAWEYLPNANSHYIEITPRGFYPRAVKPLLEATMHLPPGDWLENWEMGRKLRKFGQMADAHPEACFSPDQCKGHFDDHGEYIQRAFADRMSVMEEATL